MLHRFFHFLKQSLLVVLCILLLGGLLAGGWFFYQGRQLYRSAASSYPVASMYDTICARGSYTSYDALPQIYINAVICTEDEHFMTHKGIDPGAIARALLADLRTHSLAEGGSIYVLDMGEPVKIMDLAKQLIRFYGYEPGVNMEIKIVGLRPGEKLYEELMMDEEQDKMRRTQHNKIFVASPRTIDLAEFYEQLQALEAAAAHNDEGVVRQLAAMIPTFTPTRENLKL